MYFAQLLYYCLLTKYLDYYLDILALLFINKDRCEIGFGK